MKPSYRFLLALAVLLIFAGQSRAQSELLSKFLETRITSRLIIIEGDRWIDKDKDALIQIIQGNQTLPKKIVNVARQCDYTVEEYKGAFLLRKRYSDQRELPCVSAEEIAAYTQQVIDATTPLFGGVNQRDCSLYVNRLLLSLPQDQWQMIQANCIPVNALDSEGKQAIDALTTEAYYGGLQSAGESVLRWSKRFDHASMLLSKQDSLVITDQNDFTVEPSDAYLLFDLKLSADKATSEDAMLANASFSSTNLAGILDLLNARNKDQAFSAASSLLYTPVSVAGLTAAEPRRVLSCVAHLYGYDITVRSGTVKLARRSIGIGDVTDIGTRIATMLPLPLKATINNRNYESAGTVLLSPLIAPLQKQPTHALPIKILTRAQRTALAFILFDRLAMEVKDSAAGLPIYLRDKDNLFLKCRRVAGKSLKFTFLQRREGNMYEGAQISTSADVARE